MTSRSVDWKMVAASVPAVWLIQLQCGSVKMSFVSQSIVTSPTVLFPAPSTTKQTALLVERCRCVGLPRLSPSR